MSRPVDSGGGGDTGSIIQLVPNKRYDLGVHLATGGSTSGPWLTRVATGLGLLGLEIANTAAQGPDAIITFDCRSALYVSQIVGVVRDRGGEQFTWAIIEIGDAGPPIGDVINDALDKIADEIVDKITPALPVGLLILAGVALVAISLRR